MKQVVNKISKLASASRKSRVSELAAVHPRRNSSGRVWLLLMNGVPVGVRGFPGPRIRTWATRRTGLKTCTLRPGGWEAASTAALESGATICRRYNLRMGSSCGLTMARKGAGSGRPGRSLAIDRSAGLQTGCRAGVLARAPNPLPPLQPCSFRITHHIADGTLQLVPIANEPVIILPLPERAAATEDFVCPSGRKGLPALQHVAQFLPRQQPANKMHVIGHDTPGHKPIPLSLPEMQSVGHEFANAWIAQETCAQAAIRMR